MSTPLTAEIRHYNIDAETGRGEWLLTDYQIDSEGGIEIIQSWKEEGGVMSVFNINLLDLTEAIRQQKGWL